MTETNKNTAHGANLELDDLITHVWFKPGQKIGNSIIIPIAKNKPSTLIQLTEKENKND